MAVPSVERSGASPRPHHPDNRGTRRKWLRMTKRRHLTPEQKAAKVATQRARRHAKTPPRVPTTAEEYRLKRLGAMRRRRAEFRAQFVGPSWPSGLRRDHAVNPKTPRPSRGRPERQAVAGPIGPPKPARAILAAALRAERQSAAEARRDPSRRQAGASPSRPRSPPSRSLGEAVRARNGRSA
jgi:hypothetical protein